MFRKQNSETKTTDIQLIIRPDYDFSKYRVFFNDCLFSFTYQIALILHFWYKIGGKIFICVVHLMNSDLK